MLTFGIEEEFVFLDCSTLTPAPVAADVQELLADYDFAPGVVQSEFLRSQVEYASPVFTTFEEAARSLWGFRTALADCAADGGVLAAGVGTPFSNPAGTMITENDRYGTIAHSIGALAPEHHLNGLHIHVGVADRDVAVAALNDLRGWLPTLLAMSANSPFWCGADSSFASWRAIQFRRWTTAGCPPRFADAADYDRRTQALIGIGVTADKGSISWSARLSNHQPTLEIRVADAQLEPATTLLLALLGRALVATSTAGGSSLPVVPDPELLDASMWHSARHGLSAHLVDPRNSRLAPAAEVVQALLDNTRPALEESGDLAIVTALAEQLLLVGTGADRQRQAFTSGGREGLAAFLATAIQYGASAHQPDAGHLGPQDPRPLASGSLG